MRTTMKTKVVWMSILIGALGITPMFGKNIKQIHGDKNDDPHKKQWDDWGSFFDNNNNDWGQPDTQDFNNGWEAVNTPASSGGQFDWGQPDTQDSNNGWEAVNTPASSGGCTLQIKTYDGPVNNDAKPQNVQGCGQPGNIRKREAGNSSEVDVPGRIVGGETSAEGQWPWQVAISYDSRQHFCGASLINERWVLTAAHCFDMGTSGDSPPCSPNVVFGEHTYGQKEGPEIWMKPKEVFVHKDYDDVSSTNDIALIKLPESVNTASKYVTPVCLDTANQFYPGDKCWISGWGSTNVVQAGVDNNDQSSTVLKHVQVPIVEQNKCENLYRQYKYSSNQVCAGHAKGGLDSCQGDSGGPLQCAHNDNFYQHGIVSYGAGCGAKDNVGVYTRVAAYAGWIASVMGNN